MKEKSLNILLVDNDEQCLQAYTIALEPGNFTCSTENDPEQALLFYKNTFHTQNRIDVIITDLLMPGMSGIELLRRIKSFDETAKVIIVTAFPDSLILKTELTKEIYAIFPKPLHFSSLISILNKIKEEYMRNSNE
ncbi:MAG: response regulator [Spirochaetales bacterium]|nr:response regulator [Spirochaetales bacterium]